MCQGEFQSGPRLSDWIKKSVRGNLVIQITVYGKSFAVIVTSFVKGDYKDMLEKVSGSVLHESQSLQP